jgi:cytochrome c-type biogenesis protein
VDSATLSLAVTAGALAALNPCGFALLPAYLSLLVLPEAVSGDARSLRRTGAAVGRALLTTGLMTAGFIAVFALFGLVVSPVAAAAQEYLPWVTAATGVVLAALGVALLAGAYVRLPMPTVRGHSGRGAAATVMYGVTYAVASLTCTVAPFLAIVVTSLRSDALGEGLALFVAYALGMGVVVGVAAVAVALASSATVGRMRSAGRVLPRVAGGLVLVVGLYVAYYGVWEIRVLNGADPADPVVDTALAVQGWLSDLVRSVLQ